MRDITELVTELTSNNQKKLYSAITFITKQLEKGFYGEVAVKFVVEDGHIQSVEKVKKEKEK